MVRGHGRDTRLSGQRAEDAALRFLKRQGLRLVRRNFRCRHGEIDLIMLHADHLVFVEVRRRGSRSYVRAVLTVNFRKQQKLIRTAGFFLSKHRHCAGRPCRFDVVGVHADDNYRIEWMRDAFRPDA